MSSISLTGASQSLSQYLQGLTANTSSYSGGAGSTTATPIASQFLSFTSEAMHHHNQGAGLFHQIQQAVTSALQSGGSSNANAAIQTAIAQVLKSNAGTIANPNFSAPAPTNQSAQSFLQTLQANGVTPQQFQNDLLAAMQEEGVNPQSVASQIPPGLLVDAIV